MKSTKIVCTIGPSSQNEEVLGKFVDYGMNIVRLNLSHNTHEYHKKTIELTRKIAKDKGKYIGILFDLQGPKIRIGALKKDNIILHKGEYITLTPDDIIGDWNVLSINYKNLPEEAKIGEKIYLDDGNIELKVVDIKDRRIVCKIIDGGIIRAYKGVNLPDTDIKIPALTEKDIKDLDFGLDQDIDFIALSFVRTAEDILQLKEILDKKDRNIPVIAKIEKPKAIANIDEIIDVSDGIMVARGDLGAETSPQDVPILQKMIIKKCNMAGKPVITATQMLETMIQHPRPTRAEASDVANAIFDGTDAVMLSGETALGKYPVESVRIMSNIAQKAEIELYKESFSTVDRAKYLKDGCIDDAICFSAYKISKNVNAKYIVAFTLSGKTAALISKYRPPIPILAMSPDERVLNKCSILWGVHSIYIDLVISTEVLISEAEKIMIDNGYCKEDDVVIITGGVPVFEGEPTNMMKIHKIKIDKPKI